MQLDDVLRRRRMVRRFTTEPVAPEDVDRLVAAALRAPSAGFAQGTSLLVLTDAVDRDRYWGASDYNAPNAQRAEVARRLRVAPLIVIPVSSATAYRERYAEQDKTGVAGPVDEWAVPYWHVDAAFAAMLVLLEAVDLGLGALFMGMSVRFARAVADAFGMPDDREPLGAVLVGHRHPEVGPNHREDRRKTASDVVHYGHWNGA